MRKNFLLILILLSVLLCFTGCNMPSEQKISESNSSKNNTIMITEKMYVTWINEIYTNTNAYVNKIINLEGMFSSYFDKESKTMHYFVYRVGPGCCGNDGAMCGFEFTGNVSALNEKDWINVTGILETYMHDGVSYLRLKDCSVQKKSERGQEVVAQ